MHAVILALFALSFSGAAAQESPQQSACMPLGSALTRTTLYFGLNLPTGNISERQWRNFLKQVVTPKFPNGLTVWEANGQWKGKSGQVEREKAKVLLLVHDNSDPVKDAIRMIISEYKRSFRQESVLWETASVCAAF